METTLQRPAVQNSLFPRTSALRTRGTDEGLIVDLFAGGGGASIGIESAMGRAVDVGINHDPHALKLHAANHPDTEHLCEDIWQAHPREVAGELPIDLLWASPDCKHFSRAKGGKPVSKNIRSLAWAVLPWLELPTWQRPKMMFLENVAEFLTWGPLDEEGQPIKAKAGEEFERWKSQIEALGYVVDHRTLVAADYGTPTTRKRLFLVARCDGQPIQWPERTHAPRDVAEEMGLLPWRPAADCIDWSIPAPSIFERKKELAEATQRRIARGIQKYVIDSADPFVVVCNHGGDGFRGHGIDDPISTVTASRDARGVVIPTITPIQHFNGHDTAHDAADPLRTITAHPKGGSFALSTATLATVGYGEREGQAPRVPGIDKPVGTLVGTNKHALVSAHLSRQFGNSVGQDLDQPQPTICGGVNKTALATAFLAKHYTGVTGHGVERPIGTVTAIDHHSLVTPLLAKYHSAHGEESRCAAPDCPIATLDTQNRFGLVTPFLQRFKFGETRHCDTRDPHQTICAGGNHHALVCPMLVKMYGTCQHGQSVEATMPTVTAGGNHIAEVRAFLVKYYSSGGQDQAATDPLHTVTSKSRLGLVTVEGVDYQIVDIGLRMLKPHELLAAQFGRFADEYVLTGTQAQQVAAIGNSVCPELAEAVVRANQLAVNN